MNKNEDLSKRQYTEVLILLILLVFIIVNSVYMSVESSVKSQNLNGNNVTEINDMWTSKIDDTEYVYNFNTVFKGKEDETIILTKNLEGFDIGEDEKLCIINSFAEFIIYMDDEIIYSYYNDDFYNYYNVAREKIHLVDIPKGKDNNKITIEFIKSSNSKINYSIDLCMIGTEVSIKNTIIEKDFILLFINILAICIGLIILSIGILGKVRKIKRLDDLFLIATFIILTATYILFGTYSMQLFVNNIMAINSVTYTSLLILPISIGIMISKNIITKYKKYIDLINGVLILNAITQILITFFKIRDYRNMIFHTNIILGILLPLTLLISYKSSKEKMEKDNLFFISSIPLILGSFIEIILFLNGHYMKAIFFQIGLLFFAGIQFYTVILEFINFYANSLYAKAYKELAYKDIMTGISNRLAFENKIKEINDDLHKYKCVWCISFDLNNLKITNDTLGHGEGDKLIKTLSRALKEVFGSYNLFRIGGDEFFSIICDISENEFKKKMQEFHYKLKAINKYEKNKVYVAIGYEKLVCGSGENVFDTIKKADKAMYLNKKKTKINNLKC